MADDHDTWERLKFGSVVSSPPLRSPPVPVSISRPRFPGPNGSANPVSSFGDHTTSDRQGVTIASGQALLFSSCQIRGGGGGKLETRAGSNVLEMPPLT